MIQFLAYGVAAATAFLLNGCKSQSEEKKQVSSKDGSADSSADSASSFKPPKDAGIPSVPIALQPDSSTPVFAPITETLKGHSLAQKAYQALKQKGVSLEKLDQGCHIKNEIQGGGDHQVEPCEVYEFALDNFRQYPEVARLIAGQDLPWSLDDLIDNNSFDEEKREQVNGAIKALKENPELKALDSQSPEFREKMAFGLFYFIGFPEKPPRFGPEKTKWLEITRKLRFLGLHDFQEYLFRKGGLGTQDFQRGKTRIYMRGALGALQTRKGGDAAKSNVLFAVFDLAGLEPFFTKIPYHYAHSQKDFIITKGQGNSNIYLSEYTGIGISLGETTQLFHPDEMVELSGLTKNTPVKSLRQYLGNFLRIFAEDLYEQGGDKNQTLSLIRQSLELYPENATGYVSLGQHLEGEDKEKAYRRGLERDPDDWFLHMNLAMYLEEAKKDYQDSLKHYIEALRINSDYFNTQYLSAAKSVAKKVREKDPRNKPAIDFLLKIQEIQKERNAPSRW